jgi:hypothetical protein
VRGRWLPFGLWIAVGCSDSSEATLQIVDRDGNAGGRDGAPAGSGGNNTSGASQTGGRSGAPDAGPDGSVGGGGGLRIDAGTDSGALDDGPGVLVAYDIRSTEKKLYVLDPETGRPLASEAMGTVRAVVNDGARYPADRWFVFEQASTADRGMTVRVRSLDAVTGVFRDLGAVADAPMIAGRPVSFGGAGKSFVAYLSELATGSLSKLDLVLTVIDATDPANPRLVPATGNLPSGPKLGLVADGDSLNVVAVQGAPCPIAASGNQECNVSVVHAAVTPSAVTIGSATVVGKTGPEGNLEFVVDSTRHRGVVGIPPVAPPSQPACNVTSRSAGSALAFAMDTATPDGPVSIPVESARFAGAAFDSCSGVLFLTSLADDVAIWAVSMGASGTTTKVCAADPGGALVYEGSSRSLFRAVPSGGLEVYRVDATGLSPSLTSRALRDLPSGFHFGAVAARSPRQPTCR